MTTMTTSETLLRCLRPASGLTIVSDELLLSDHLFLNLRLEKKSGESAAPMGQNFLVIGNPVQILRWDDGMVQSIL